MGTGFNCLINLVEKCQKQELAKNDNKNETNETCPSCLKKGK